METPNELSGQPNTWVSSHAVSGLTPPHPGLLLRGNSPPTLQGGGLGGSSGRWYPITSCSSWRSSSVLFPWSSRMSPARPFFFTSQSYPCLLGDSPSELAAELSPPGHFPQPLRDYPPRRACYPLMTITHRGHCRPDPVLTPNPQMLLLCQPRRGAPSCIQAPPPRPTEPLAQALPFFILI